LSPCFEGQTEPGALRWQATVDPATGVVSDQRFDTRLDTPTARCLRAALANPPYRLEGGTGPVPITMLIEF
jgi:GGDEF domain-containing protein